MCISLVETFRNTPLLSAKCTFIRHRQLLYVCVLENVPIVFPDTNPDAETKEWIKTSNSGIQLETGSLDNSQGKVSANLVILPHSS